MFFMKTSVAWFLIRAINRREALRSKTAHHTLYLFPLIPKTESAALLATHGPISLCNDDASRPRSLRNDPQGLESARDVPWKSRDLSDNSTVRTILRKDSVSYFSRPSLRGDGSEFPA